MRVATVRARLGALRPLAIGLVVVAVVVGMAAALRGQDWNSVQALTQGTDLVLFGVALVANAAGLFLGMVCWQALLASVAPPVSRWASARVFVVGFVTKFLPGRFWGLLANIQMGRAIGVTPLQMTAANVLNIVVTGLTGLAVGMLAVPSVFGDHAGWLALAVLPLVFCLARPDLVLRAAGMAARLLRRPALAVTASGRGVRRAIAAQAMSWAVSGHHLWLLAVAAGAPPARSYLVCVGVYGLAWVAGALVLVVPDGIGVREGVLTAALATLLPLPVAGVVALASRLVSTLSQIAFAAGTLLVAELVRRRAGVVTRKQQPGSGEAVTGKGEERCPS